jgi:hypothetical protein
MSRDPKDSKPWMRRFLRPSGGTYHEKRGERSDRRSEKGDRRGESGDRRKSDHDRRKSSFPPFSHRDRDDEPTGVNSLSLRPTNKPEEKTPSPSPVPATEEDHDRLEAIASVAAFQTVAAELAATALYYIRRREWKTARYVLPPGVISRLEARLAKTRKEGTRPDFLVPPGVLRAREDEKDPK